MNFLTFQRFNQASTARTINIFGEKGKESGIERAREREREPLSR